MASYQGQDKTQEINDGITKESLLSIIDKKTGKAMDVREVLGISEEDFKNNPELLEYLQEMNAAVPVPEETKENKRDMDQKARHFLNFGEFDTLPFEMCQLDDDDSDTQTMATSQSVVEPSWNEWWECKHLAN